MRKPSGNDQDGEMGRKLKCLANGARRMVFAACSVLELGCVVEPVLASHVIGHAWALQGTELGSTLNLSSKITIVFNLQSNHV